MSFHRRSSASGRERKSSDIKPNNPMQADFDSDDNSTMDADERLLVRLDLRGNESR